jgi:hypothetical protein
MALAPKRVRAHTKEVTAVAISGKKPPNQPLPSGGKSITRRDWLCAESALTVRVAAS